MTGATLGGRTVRVLGCGKRGVPAVYVSMYSDTAEALLEACAGIGCPDFDLVAVSGLDWNRDTSPWPADPVGRGGEPFAGGADDYLQFLGDEVVPYAEGILGEPSGRVVAGYSMGGLLALYAPHRTGLFSACVSASGSLWYPGFHEFVSSEGFARRPRSIYISLGDREARTRDPVMSTVEDRSRGIQAAYAGRGIDSVFELNPGGHFRGPDARLAKGIAWTLTRKGVTQ